VERIGRYSVQRLLGAGAMDEVWLAEDPDLQRPVAIKRMAASVAADHEQRQ
jgi:serine/threonine protein kinase